MSSRNRLLGAFSLIVNQFQAISTFAAVIARLSSMVGAADDRPSSATLRSKSLELMVALLTTA